jgi:hypothetical protein
MSNAKNIKYTKNTFTTSTWRERLARQADLLEAQANTARIIAMAETDLDGAAVACDVVRAVHHTEVTRRARAAGQASPPPPAPISKLLTQFMEALHDKIQAVGALLSEREVSRLASIAPRVLERLEAQDDDVRHTLAELLPMQPDAIAMWLALSLPELEARFAS